MHFPDELNVGELSNSWVTGLPDIAQRAALDSCYTRFSQFAVWMGSWDVDEFAIPLSSPTYRDLLAPYTYDDNIASVSMRTFYHRPTSACSAGDLAGIAKMAGIDLPDSNTTTLCPDGMFHLGSWCLRAKDGNRFAPKQFFKTSHVISHCENYLGAHTHGREFVLNHTAEARMNRYKLPDEYATRGLDAETLRRHPEKSTCCTYQEPPLGCSPKQWTIDKSVTQFLPEVKVALQKWYPNLRPKLVVDDRHDHDHDTKGQVLLARRVLENRNGSTSGFFLETGA